MKPDLPKLKGSHYRMGMTAAQRLKRHAGDRSIRGVCSQREGGQLANLLALYAPELLCELRGVARSWGCSAAAAAEVLSAPAITQVGCSAFWVCGRHTADGTPLFGRNWDYRPHAAEDARLVTTRPLRGFCHLSFTNHPIGRYGGTNETGLMVATAVVPARKKGDGLGFTLATRRMLETCASVNQACEFLQSIPHRSAVNFLIADSEGEAARLEIEPGRLKEERINDFAAIANHFASVPQQLASPRLLKSRKRMANLRGWFGANSGRLDDRLAQQVLSDPEEGVCARGNPNVDFATVTLWSWIGRPGARRLKVAMGSPHCTPYETHVLAAEEKTAARSGTMK